MNADRPPDQRTVALDGYLARRAADGYRVETRTGFQAVIFRRRRPYFVRRWFGAGASQTRLVVSVDQDGDVSTIDAQPVRW